MKTLVIHPADRSTDFLSRIYTGNNSNGWAINTDCRNVRLIKEQIKNHDRIITMGHGSPMGLFYTPINSNPLNEDVINLLKDKQCICIWCNADQFVLRHGLNGFYTGMFISEVMEAEMFGITISQNMIDRSNRDFAFEMSLCLNHTDPKLIYEEIKDVYVGPTSVYEFNKERFYYSDGKVRLITEKQMTI